MFFYFQDGTFCSPETDKYPGSGITWNGTKINQTDEQPCLDANGPETVFLYML